MLHIDNFKCEDQKLKSNPFISRTNCVLAQTASKREFPRQFAFAKSLSGKYLFVCETFAEAAGLDSPAQAIGLKDQDMPWRDWAKLLWQEDSVAFRGGRLINEPQTTRYAQNSDKIHLLLQTKTALRDSENHIIGTIGSAIDITEFHLFQRAGHFDAAGKKFTMSQSGLSFSKKQIIILHYLVAGYSAAEIGNLVYRSKRTIEGHIEQLKYKCQCSSKPELIRYAVTSGLLYSVDDSLLPKHSICSKDLPDGYLDTN